MKPEWDDGGGLRWLFLDLNSYFASVEQQEDPRLRGRPVIVAPVSSEYTCAIAASYQAKRCGIRTGTAVKEARRLCPGLVVIEARPEVYVAYHHRILEEIGRHLPIHAVRSIDEAVCELAGPERLEAKAVAVARRVQAAIKANVGECLGSSVGLAPSRLLAKLASTMQKPDGLTVLRRDALPGPLLQLRLKDIPGVGSNMEKRLKAAGVDSVQALWDLTPYRARRLWGSVEGDRVWHGLHGTDDRPEETERSSIGHGCVLAPEFRELDGARQVARRLVVKCGARLRRMGLKTAALSLTLDTEAHFTGAVERRLAPTHDSFALLQAIDALWAEAGVELHGKRLRFVAVNCTGLVQADAAAPDLFGWTAEAEEDPRRLRLSHALDNLNRRFGKDTVTIGPTPDIKYLGAKIAFTRIPELEEFVE